MCDSDQQDPADRPEKREEPPAGALPFEELEPAYEKLLRDLWLASEIWRRVDQRRGIEQSIDALVSFLRRRHENPELGGPLLDVRAAFHDLRNAKLPPLFDVSGEARKRPRDAEAWHERRLAAACVEALIASGMRKDEAVRTVRQHVSRWPRAREMKVSLKTIGGWRDEFSARGDRNDRQYDDIVRHLLEGGDPRATALALLQDPPLGARNPENPP